MSMPTKDNVAWGGTQSHTQREVILTLYGSGEELRLPVKVTTKVWEVKEVLCQKLGIEDGSAIQFITKSGGTYKQIRDIAEIATRVTVKGIKSWTRSRVKWPHPTAIIGAGHGGLRMAMTLMKWNVGDYCVYDRWHRVGGTAWVANANPSSKLQTEYGVYHLEFDELNPIPKKFTTAWPSSLSLLDHFQDTCEQYGVMPHVVLNTEVTIMEVEEDKKLPAWDERRTVFHITSQKAGEIDGDESVSSFSTVCCFPGGLINPRRMEYQGEDVFDGEIGYGMFDEFPYAKVKGQQACIIGAGAFAVENVRTCLEYGAEKCFMLCRRKNITIPRCVDWLINSNIYPVNAALMLDAMKPYYALGGEDPWDYYAVNRARGGKASIAQKSRFGIGDVYFLAVWYGKAETVVDEVKRFTPSGITLENTARYLDVQHAIKVLGFQAGDPKVDSLFKIKEMTGYHVNGDLRRAICSEFPGVDAGKFGGTSFYPGFLLFTEIIAWFYLYPKDFALALDTGFLPRRKANPDDSSRSAYMWDPRNGGTVAMILTGGAVPGLAEHVAATHATVGRSKMYACHPLESFVEACAEEWKSYCKMFHKSGDDRPYPPYPYTVESMQAWVRKNDEEGEEEMKAMTARNA